MLQPEDGTLTDFGTWLIASPLMALLLFTASFAMAGVLVRSVPVIRRTVIMVETTRHRPVDGLRGFLGIGVFIHHTVVTWFYLHGHGWQQPPSRVVMHLGKSSVALFFMITAFLFWSRVIARGNSFDWVEFFLSRLYRLYPVYLLMLGLVVTAAFALTWPERHGFDAADMQPLLGWILMLDAPDLNGLPDTNLLVAGVTWSLRYEWLFYLALPFLAFAAWRCRRPVVALLSVGALVAVWNLPGRSDLYYLDILGSFVGGIVAAHWVRNPRLAAIGRTTGAGLAAMLALSIVALCVPTAYTWQATLNLSIFFVVVASGHSLWGILDRPALLWIGDITYSIYLLHGLLLWAVFRWLLPHEVSIHATIFVGSAMAIAGALILLSSAVYLVIERPTMLLGKRHYRWIVRNVAARRADRQRTSSTSPGEAPTSSAVRRMDLAKMWIVGDRFAPNHDYTRPPKH
jgi:peptidoglycan/LPS O-acetylase OafA/YrhL